MHPKPTVYKCKEHKQRNSVTIVYCLIGLVGLPEGSEELLRNESKTDLPNHVKVSLHGGTQVEKTFFFKVRQVAEFENASTGCMSSLAAAPLTVFRRSRSRTCVSSNGSTLAIGFSARGKIRYTARRAQRQLRKHTASTAQRTLRIDGPRSALVHCFFNLHSLER